MLSTAAAIERLLNRLAAVTTWATIVPITLLTLLQVAGRWVDLGATGELPQISIVLMYAAVMLLFGWTYVGDEHVRVDIFHRHWSRRRRAWVEIAGCAVALFPLSIVLSWYGGQGLIGLPAGAETTEWIAGGAALAGPVLLGLGGVAVTLRSIVVLLARPGADDAAPAAGG